MTTEAPLTFSPESQLQSAQMSPAPPWHVLIVDDDHDVHTMTAFILRDISFETRHLHLLHAHSASEARAVLATAPDIAAAVIDVVMETDRAGLDLVHHIRREIGNRAMAILLRTGFPGRAPERSIIFDYEINDYKTKTELTAERLVTSIIAGLRYYSMYQQLVESREHEIDALIANYQSRRELQELQTRRDAERRAELCAIADTIEMETLKRLSSCIHEVREILSPSHPEDEDMESGIISLVARLDGLTRTLEDLSHSNRSIIDIVRSA